ncbi:MAG: hypothetical protein K2P79_11780 [Sphingomonas sp.]|nr:hypothetical protein [Sphingomonas sp.]
MKIGYFIAASLLAIAAPAFAQSPFDGSWKGDTATAQLTDKPFVRTLREGVYSCDSCNTPFSVKADGAFHPVKGQDYVDEMSVAVAGNVVTSQSRKGGKLVNVSTDTVATDGMTVDWTNKDMSAVNGTPVEAKGRDKRVGAAPPADAHPLSGGWITQNDGLAVSESGLIFKMAVKGDVFTLSTPTGLSFAATFGGPAVAMQGDIGGTTVKVKRIDATTLEETDIRGGKAVNVYTYRLHPDGKALDVTSYNPIQKSTSKFKMTKL